MQLRATSKFMAHLLNIRLSLFLCDFASTTVSNIIEQSCPLMTRWSTFEIFRHTRTSTTRNDQWRTRLRIIDDAARDPKNPLHKLWSHHTRGRALRNDLSVFHKN